MNNLRDYQELAVHDLRQSMGRGKRAPILVAPPGAGKTRVASEIVKSALDKGNATLMLAPRRELVYQPSQVLSEQGIEHGLILAGEEPDGTAPVQVASWDTLRSWLKRDKIDHKDFGLIVVDECHLMTPNRANLLRQNWPNVRIIGLTATPARQQGASLGKWFDDLVYGPSMRELIDRGFLLEPEYYVPTTPDKSRMRLVGGDYSAESVAKVLGDSAIIGDVVSHWCWLGAGRSTVLFAATVAHATHFRDAFVAVGARAVVLHGGTPLTERMDIIRRVNEGDIDVLCTVSVVDVGWDCPALSCAINARTTRSIVRYIQTLSRPLRPYGDQKKALILDHAGVVEELGLLDEDRPWSLEAEGKVQDRDRRLRQVETRSERTCKNCGFVFQNTECPRCGWVPPTRSKAPNVVEGELHKLNGEPRKWSREDRRRFFGELLGAAIKMGYKRGFAVPAYKQKLKTLPWEDGAYRGVHPLEPSPEVMGWVRHLRIRRAKAHKRYSNNGG